MSALLAIAPALPLGKAGKFVAGAYIVFLVLILVYVAIMAMRAQRTERELAELQRDVEAARARETEAESEHEVVGSSRMTHAAAIPARPDVERRPA